MNDAVITDLKQFITTTVSQQLAAQTIEFDGKLERLENRLNNRFGGLSDIVANALDTANETTHKQLHNHEHRITKLEKATA